MAERMLVGCGAGFSGDRLDAAVAVVRDLRGSGERSAIIFETLGERTLALAQLRRREDIDSRLMNPSSSRCLRPC